MLKLKIIKWDWRDIKSIEKAEKEKAKLENAGYMFYFGTLNSITYIKEI